MKTPTKKPTASELLEDIVFMLPDADKLKQAILAFAEAVISEVVPPDEWNESTQVIQGCRMLRSKTLTNWKSLKDKLNK